LYRSPELIAALALFSIQIYADCLMCVDVAETITELFGVDLKEYVFATPS
jgi:hypothetical protein